MEAELAALATSGATTLVGLMVSDSWAQSKERLAALFGRGRRGRSAEAEEELDLSREELIAAREAGDGPALADVEAEWRSRLKRLLRADPAAADELRALLEELAPRQAADAPGAVHNTVTGGVLHGPLVQGRDFGSLTFHAPPYAPTPDPARTEATARTDAPARTEPTPRTGPGRTS
ncbi:hypothetical protein [Streptomyces sp. URMC 123]|uniref:hypothetical protein n=1 Tax=Streptomyces sp. URMC 123 TaxID=3423403 RepID=UPI003F1D5D1E